MLIDVESIANNYLIANPTKAQSIAFYGYSRVPRKVTYHKNIDSVKIDPSKFARNPYTYQQYYNDPEKVIKHYSRLVYEFDFYLNKWCFLPAYSFVPGYQKPVFVDANLKWIPNPQFDLAEDYQSQQAKKNDKQKWYSGKTFQEYYVNNTTTTTTTGFANTETENVNWTTATIVAANNTNNIFTVAVPVQMETIEVQINTVAAPTLGQLFTNNTDLEEYEQEYWDEIEEEYYEEAEPYYEDQIHN